MKILRILKLVVSCITGCVDMIVVYAEANVRIVAVAVTFDRLFKLNNSQSYNCNFGSFNCCSLMNVCNIALYRKYS